MESKVATDGGSSIGTMLQPFLELTFFPYGKKPGYRKVSPEMVMCGIVAVYTQPLVRVTKHTDLCTLQSDSSTALQ